MEIMGPSRRTEFHLDKELNDESLREELDLIEEIQLRASLREATLSYPKCAIGYQ